MTHMLQYQQCTYFGFLLLLSKIIWKIDKSLTNCTTKKKLNTSFQKPPKYKEFLIHVKPPPKSQFS